MEAQSLPSLTPLIQSADQWGEVVVLLPLLVALEAVLSADNAIALAAISRQLHDRRLQERALNLGLLLAMVFRLALILAARWVLRFWPLQLLASAYLLWLCTRHLLGWDETEDGEDEGPAASLPPAFPPSGQAPGKLKTPAVAAPRPGDPHAHQHHHGPAMAAVVTTLAFTDLAFSLDSISAAVAVTDRVALVMIGGVIGVIALRLTAELFIRWLEVFPRLETAGYLAVGLVGLRLLTRVSLPQLVLPEWALLVFVGGLFLWGFSLRDLEPAAASAETGGGGGGD
jgi:YkoY family integral membrane protein